MHAHYNNARACTSTQTLAHARVVLWPALVWVDVICAFLARLPSPWLVLSLSVQLCGTLMTWSLCNLIAARPDELSHSFISFQSTPHRTHNCLLTQTNAPLAVLCTCYLVHQPSSSVRQVHLSASTTLKCAIRFGQEEAEDVRNVMYHARAILKFSLRFKLPGIYQLVWEIRWTNFLFYSPFHIHIRRQNIMLRSNKTRSQPQKTVAVAIATHNQHLSDIISTMI